MWLDGLSKVCLPFLVLKLPVRGKREEEKNRKMGEGEGGETQL
jgi:hypothetical protein